MINTIEDIINLANSLNEKTESSLLTCLECAVKLGRFDRGFLNLSGDNGLMAIIRIEDDSAMVRLNGYKWEIAERGVLAVIS